MASRATNAPSTTGSAAAGPPQVKECSCDSPIGPDADCGVASSAVLALGVASASAHVGVSSADAAPGGYGAVTLRVPNESDTASTIALRVQIPAETPLASVRTKPVPGWTATLTRSPIDPPVDVNGTEVSEAGMEIVWTAEPGGGIGPGQYQTFSINGGPFADIDTITFPVLQTYDDGDESAWIQPTLDGQPEPENPAPVLTLVDVAADGNEADGAVTEAAARDSDDSDSSGLAVTALVLGAAGLLAGLAGLGVALASRRRNT